MSTRFARTIVVNSDQFAPPSVEREKRKLLAVEPSTSAICRARSICLTTSRLPGYSNGVVLVVVVIVAMPAPSGRVERRRGPAAPDDVQVRRVIGVAVHVVLQPGVVGDRQFKN